MADLDCQSCGACCKGLIVDVGWGDDVPPHMVKDDPLDGPVMRTRGGQCIALKGVIGKRVSCSIYEDRPQVCRDFGQFCNLCVQVRREQGLNSFESPVVASDPRTEELEP